MAHANAPYIWLVRLFSILPTVLGLQPKTPAGGSGVGSPKPTGVKSKGTEPAGGSGTTIPTAGGGLSLGLPATTRLRIANTELHFEKSFFHSCSCVNTNSESLGQLGWCNMPKTDSRTVFPRLLCTKVESDLTETEQVFGHKPTSGQGSTVEKCFRHEVDDCDR